MIPFLLQRFISTALSDLFLAFQKQNCSVLWVFVHLVGFGFFGDTAVIRC